MSTPAATTLAAPAVATAPLLEIRNVTVRFGGVTALNDVSFTVPQGQIVGIIGPNGAGKTSLFNCLSRLYRPSEGEIVFDGTPLAGLPRHRVASLGIGRTFQNVALFDRMSVQDNVLLGAHVQSHSGFLAHAFKLPSTAREEKALRQYANEVMQFMDIQGHADREAGGLPFPIRKRIELARALMARPKLLLLDEPAAGLNHEEVENLKGQIFRIRDYFDVTVLLVEHHMNLVMSISQKIIAIEFGKLIAEGTPAEVRTNPRVIQAYLGEGADA